MSAENAAYRAKNPDYSKKHYAKNIEKEAKRKADYYLQNKDKVKARIDSYGARKPHVRTAITAKRRAKLLQATPAWADFEAIKSFYACAKTMETPHEVDHIVPLQGKNVCGLHWEKNLQVIPKTENRKKSSKLLEA